MKTSYSYTLEGWEYDEQPIDVELELNVDLSPYDPGCTYGPPENCYPPEGGQIEGMEITVESASYTSGEPVDQLLVPAIEQKLQDEYDKGGSLQNRIDEFVYEQPPPERDYDDRDD